MGKLLACLLSVVLGGCATATSHSDYFAVDFDLERPFGLIAGEVESQRFRGLPACEDGLICTNGVYEFRLKNPVRLAGSPGTPMISTVWVVQHGAAPVDLPMAFIVQKTNDGRLWATTRGWAGERTACFSDGAWQHHRELLEIAGGELVDDSVCVPVNN